MEEHPRPTSTSYDPTRNPLPASAIRAPPGQRQIAYPCVTSPSRPSCSKPLAIYNRKKTLQLNPSSSSPLHRPDFPRAKINGNGTVHLGVRPRAVPAPTSTSMNNDGLLAAAAAAAEAVKQGRRPGYGELGSEAEADGPETDSLTSHLPARVQDGGSSVSQGSHVEDCGTTSTSTPTSTDRRARPKMTLEQAVTQYDRTHPPSAASSHTTTTTTTTATANANAKQTQHPSVHQVKDDVRSHDGVYTYDYTNATHPPGSNAGRTTAPAASDSDEQDSHARGYPEAPVKDDAYGVPFGKRLKAIIKLRRDAEEAGLVPRSSAYSSSSSELPAAGEQAGSMVVGLVRRPAATSFGVDGSGYGREVQASPRRNKGKATEGVVVADKSHRDREAKADVRTSTPTTPRPFVTQRHHQPLSPPRSEHSATTTSSTVSTSTATARVKIRRKPVPQYIELSSVLTPLESTQLVRKQKSEPGMNGDSPARVERRERRRREKEQAAGAGAGGDEQVSTVTVVKRHLRSQSEQPHSSADTRSQHGTPVPTQTDDQYYMPLTHLSTLSQPQPRSGNNGAAIPPTSDQIALCRRGLIVPPMPEGEEYDAETEAERQAAWEEYYRLQAAAAGLGMYDGGQDVGYPTVEEWIDTQTQT